MALAKKSTPAPAPAAKPAPAKTVAPAPKPAAAPAPKPASSETVSGVEGTLNVTTTILENGTVQGQKAVSKPLKITPFRSAPANVSFGLKFKKNLGNFESAEVFVSVSAPCYPEEIDSMIQQVREKAAALLNEQFETVDFESLRGEVVGDADFAGETEDAVEADAEGTEEEAAADDEGGDLTPDDVRAMDRDALVELISMNELGIDDTAYEDDAELAEAVISVAFPEDEGEEGDGAEEESTGYTEEELKSLSPVDIGAVYVSWGLGTKPLVDPKTKKPNKTKMIKEILDFQNQQQ